MYVAWSAFIDSNCVYFTDKVYFTPLLFKLEGSLYHLERKTMCLLSLSFGSSYVQCPSAGHS